ncbi:NDP-hexose 2,3-dehydratase family protein, partial [Streptomyces sp. MCAF7]
MHHRHTTPGHIQATPAPPIRTHVSPARGAAPCRPPACRPAPYCGTGRTPGCPPGWPGRPPSSRGAGCAPRTSADLDYFVTPGRGQVLADALQSEHGSWFYRKSNRNMIVEALDDVPLYDDFCWLTLGQINELLHQDLVINMDARTVLSCMPEYGQQLGTEHGPSAGERALHTDAELRSWFTGERSRRELRVERVPLASVPGWVRGERSVDHEAGRYFKVVAVSVRAASREVSKWTQPLFEPVGAGVTAFVARRFGGVLHVLAHARVEGGFLDTVELGPTVQCTPGNWDHLPAADRPPFLDLVLEAGAP